MNKKGLVGAVKFGAVFAVILVSLFILTAYVAPVTSGVSYDKILTLENKDITWAIILGDGIQATLQYNNIGPEFEYSLIATGLQANTDYSLIYYADKSERFENWGGNNPGALIATFNSGTGTYDSGSQSVDLGMDLPSPPDANIAIYDYCGDPDNYANCHGAKIWLVPTNALPDPYPHPILSEAGWDFWRPHIQPEILFETDLITYTETECFPEETQLCYTGSAETEGVGECKAGTQTCTAKGVWETCEGEVTPVTEICNNGLDDDCDGYVDCADEECIEQTCGVDDICGGICIGGECSTAGNYCDLFDCPDGCDGVPDAFHFTYDYSQDLPMFCDVIGVCNGAVFKNCEYEHYCCDNDMDDGAPLIPELGKVAPDRCDADCDQPEDCDATDCDGLDGCYEGKYRDCDDVENDCNGLCSCENKACPKPSTCEPTGTDGDRDGYDAECRDCDDNDPNTYPGATEICDRKDNDCDGLIDEDVTQPCGSGNCLGTQICSTGVWGSCNSEGRDCGTCALCDSKGDCSVYDETQNTDCNIYDLLELETCIWNPDNIGVTWDYHLAIDSECQALFECSYESGYYDYTHTCDIANCDADCEDNEDCKNYCEEDILYSGGICDISTPTCECSWGFTNCNDYDCSTDLKCEFVNEATIKEIGDDYSCNGGELVDCDPIGTMDCTGPWVCDATNECNIQDCSQDSYECYMSDTGFVWGTAPATETICDDGYDNDCDGLIDCQDHEDCDGKGGPHGKKCCDEPSDCTQRDCTKESCDVEGTNECVYTPREESDNIEVTKTCYYCDGTERESQPYFGNDGVECDDDCTYCDAGECLDRDTCDGIECSGQELCNNQGNCADPDSDSFVCGECYNAAFNGFFFEPGTTASCCDDDEGENYITLGIGTEACCDSPTDCVDAKGVCQDGTEGDGDCADGYDNDCDGLIDCEDPDCDKTAPETTKYYEGSQYGEGYPKWINSETLIILEAEDYIGQEEQCASGEDKTYYRYCLKPDCYENEPEPCNCEGVEWKDYAGSFSVLEDSEHCIEYYSTDLLENEESPKSQCVYVDNIPPKPSKIISEPKTKWYPTEEEITTPDYKYIADRCWNGQEDEIECWKTTILTPIYLECDDSWDGEVPHPVNNERICFKVELDAEDATDEYCEDYEGEMGEDGFCCLEDVIEKFYFNEVSEHNLAYYCVDALGNTGLVDDEKFKVEETAFEIELNKKWNLISVPVKLLDDSMDEVFDDVSDTVEAVWTYNGETGWSVYTPDGNPANDDMTTMLPGWGYWVLSNTPDLLVIGGSLMSPAMLLPSRAIVGPGWNLIGYYGADGEEGYYGPAGNGKTAKCALNTLGTSIWDKQWTSLLSYWEPYNPYPWHTHTTYPTPPGLNKLDRMDPGAGYWLFAQEDGIYSYSSTCL